MRNIIISKPQQSPHNNKQQNHSGTSRIIQTFDTVRQQPEKWGRLVESGCPQGINYTFKKRLLIKEKRHTPEWFSGAWRIRMVKKIVRTD